MGHDGQALKGHKGAATHFLQGVAAKKARPSAGAAGGRRCVRAGQGKGCVALLPSPARGALCECSSAKGRREGSAAVAANTEPRRG